MTIDPPVSDPDMIVFSGTNPMAVTVGTDLIYFGGDSQTGTYNPGVYKVIVKAIADNNVDTGAFEELIVAIVDPC